MYYVTKQVFSEIEVELCYFKWQLFAALMRKRALKKWEATWQLKLGQFVTEALPSINQICGDERTSYSRVHERSYTRFKKSRDNINESQDIG